MSETLWSALLWREVQVTALLSGGLVLSYLLRARRATTAAIVLCGTLVSATALTVLAFTPSHLWVTAIIGQPQTVSTTIPSVPSLPIHVQQSTITNAAPAADDGWKLTFKQAAALWRAGVQTLDHATPQRFSLRLILMMVVGGWLFFGGVQLALAISDYRRLYHGSYPVTDPHIQRLIGELADRVGVTGPVEVRSHLAFADAAAGGWWRPVIFLPEEWQAWTAADLRVVLAHELVHIRRHDVRWRGLLAGVRMMHGYNPIVSLLTHQFVLLQELATDQEAAAVVGSATYVRTLAQLALNQDRRIGTERSRELLSVFSGQLLRRISLLQSKEGPIMQTRSSKRSLLTLALYSGFCVAGVAALYLRGLAEPPLMSPAIAAEQPPPAADASNDQRPTSDPTIGLFKRPRIDHVPLFGVDNPDGVVCFRPHDLLDDPRFAARINAHDNALAAIVFGAEHRGQQLIGAVEWLMMPVLVRTENKIPGKESLLSLSAQRAVARFRDAATTATVMMKVAEIGKKQPHDGQPAFSLSFPAIAPRPALIWSVDELTIAADGREQPKAVSRAVVDEAVETSDVPVTKTSGEQPAADSESTKKLNWSRTWDRIGHGVLTAVLARADWTGLLADFELRPYSQTDAGKEVVARCRKLMDSIEHVAVAFDLDPQTHPGQLGYRVHLVHRSRAAADESRLVIETLMQLVEKTLGEDLRKQPPLSNSEADQTRRQLAMAQGFRQHSFVSVSAADDGSAILTFSGVIPIEKVVEGLEDE